MSNTAVPAFLRIPREIRDQIYGHLLTHPGGFEILLGKYSKHEKSSLEPKLLLVNRQVSYEASSILYGRNRFHFNYHLSQVTRFLHTFRPSIVAMFRDLHIGYADMNLVVKGVQNPEYEEATEASEEAPKAWEEFCALGSGMHMGILTIDPVDDIEVWIKVVQHFLEQANVEELRIPNPEFYGSRRPSMTALLSAGIGEYKLVREDKEVVGDHRRMMIFLKAQKSDRDNAYSR